MFQALLSRLRLARPSNTFESTLSDLDEQTPHEMRRLLPRSFDSLEVWLLIFSGAYGLLVCSFLLRGAGELKLLCIGFLLLAVIKRYRPARTKIQWFMGALLALLLTGLIHLSPNSGGNTGPFLFLLFLLAMAYPLLMENRLAFLFGLGLVGIYYMGGVKDSTGAVSNLLILRGLLLGGTCLISTRFGAVLRQAEESMDAMRRDNQSLAYNRYGLNYYGGQLVRHCTRKGTPCTLVLLRMPMNWLSEVAHELDPVLQNQMLTLAVQDIATRLNAVAAHGSLLARTSELDWVLLVPTQNRAVAVERLVTHFGRPLQIPFGSKQDEWFVPVTPCAVEATEEYPNVPKMLACAETIWERGFSTGVV